MRQRGLSLPRIARSTIGPVAGVTTSIATLFIIVCTLSSVGIVVVNALSKSSWGMFTILVTIPAALVTSLWMYKIRPGHIAEASAIGVTLVMAGVVGGQMFAKSAWGHHLVLDQKTLSLMLPIYAAYWKTPLLAAHEATRRYLTWILTFLVWWNFLIGHILNNIKGLFS